MIRKLLLTVFLALSVSGLSAQQTAEEQKKEINRIKKSSLYLYGEATMPTEQEAKDLAEELLYADINEWVAGQKKMSNAPKVVVNNTKQLWGGVSLPRGNMFRAFFYVKKSDILPVENTQEIVPVPAASDDEAELLSSSSVPAVSPVVAEVAALKEFSALQGCLNRLKQEGKIKDYNKYAALQDADRYYLIIYNREGRIEAVLTPGAGRRNVAPGRPDAIANYAGRGAIGFLLAE